VQYLTEAVKKQKDSYEALAKALDNIPNGFPATEDGTHLKLLQWIYEPDEAELASKMKLSGETIEKLSKRLKIPEDELTSKLKTMKSKGQIYISSSRKGKKYGLFPFVIGIYEDQIHRMDEEFAQLFENYIQQIRGETLFSIKPPIQRVVPVNRVIKTELNVHPYGQAELMIKNSKSWGIRECICKKQKNLIGDDCDYPNKVCLVFSKRKNAYDGSNRTEPITMEDSLRILRETEEAGLIHTSMNVQKGHSYICNCCTCCCGILRGLTEWEQPLAFVNSDYIINVDRELCIGCGKCVKVCQMNALEVVDGISEVNDRCIGCGVCGINCPQSALELVFRKEKEIAKPPKNIIFWMIKRAISRRVNIFKVL